MAYYPDLAPCTYYDQPQTTVTVHPDGRTERVTRRPPPLFPGIELLAVGWLSGGRPYPVGVLDPALLEKLERWNERQRFAIFMGVHRCDLPGCLADPPADTGELLVAHPFRPDALYVIPSLALHYVRHHRYALPAEVVATVRAAPEEKIPRVVVDYPGRRVVWERP